MLKNVLPAKVSPPRLFDVVRRERLFALLDDNRGRPLLWIAGPPGAGKTTLVATWLETRSIPSIWYQIDAEDADPAALFDHLARGLGSVAPESDAVLPRFSAEHLGEVNAFARLYFRALFASLPPGAALVLDNYQDAPEGAPLHEIVQECARQAPRGGTIVAMSRTDAPPSFVAFTANGSMTTIGWDHLQLTQEEVNAICAKRGVTEGWLVQALHQQSQGWAAGITLMLERLEHTDGNARELPSETRESVFTYFADLIFDQTSPQRRAILLAVAFLPRVSAELAVQLSGDAEAPLLLDELYRRRLFTDRRPGPDPSYQFHALFLDFLRARARTIFAPALLSERIALSATALQQAGNVEAAMDLNLAHGRWDAAQALIVDQADRLLRSGRRVTLRRWIEALPEALRTSHPALVHWHGRTVLQTEPEAGTRVLERAAALYRAAGDRAGLLECLTTLVSGAFLGFHALDAMDGWLDEYLEEIEHTSQFASVEAELRVYGTLCMALFHARPWHERLEPAYLRVEALLPLCTDPDVALGAALGALVVSGLSGDFERGDRFADMAMALAARSTASPSEAAWCYGQVGWLRFQEARYDEALDSIGRGLEIAEANALRVVRLALTLWKFTVEWRAVRWSVADATLAQAEAMSRPPYREVMHEAQIHLFRARQATHRGQRDEGAQRALRANQTAVRLGSRLQEVIFGLSGADILLELELPNEAAPLIAHVRALAERAPMFHCYRPVVRLLEARVAELCADGPAARAALAQALALARANNNRYYLRFGDWTMPRLFAQALQTGIEPDLVRELIPLFRLKPPADAPDLWPWPIRIVTLGRFDVYLSENRLEFPHKLPRKTLSLLKAIIAFGARNVSEQVLCDALWPDDDGDAAANALSITLVRLRRLLGMNEAIAHQGGKLSLNPELCWVDAQAFERRLAADHTATLETLELYGGAFLPEDQGEPWSVAARERLRGRFIDALSGCGAALESANDATNAIRCYLRGIEADPVVEGFHQGLMRCYEGTGRRTEAISAYRRMKQVLSVVLGVPPSETSQRLYRSLLEQQAAVDVVDEPAADVVNLAVHQAKRAPRGR
ncbi:MAG: hypothetical protein K2X67_02240 [Burkholderiales bacterium]|nr:hypothetical protein [Burkholderiales bacterium]